MANIIKITLNETFDDFRRKFNTLSEFVGDSDLLTTDSDDSIVFAINSLDSNLGTRLSLTTIDKTDIVSAINELDSDIGASPDDNLTTVAKNLTAAINEHDTELGTITAVAMGTTASTVSTAIAELDGRLDSINTTELLSPRMTLSDSSATNIIRGNVQVDTSVTINNDLHVLDSANIGGNLNVDGTALLNNNAIFNSNVNIAGQLTTTGTVDMSGSSTISFGDNNVVFNADHTGVPTEDVGMTVERGNLTDAVFEWSEANRYWVASNDHANAGGGASDGLTTNRVITSGDSATVTTTMIQNGTVTNPKLTNSTIGFADSAGTTTEIALGSDVTFKGGEGIDVTNSSGTFTIAGEDASYTNKGVAKFLESDFTVTNGYVSIRDENIQDIAGAMFSGNSESNITATYQDADGTIDLSVNTASSSTLGVAKFNTANFSVSAGDVTIKDGGVANAELANSSIGFSDGTTVTEKALGTDMVFTDVTKETSVRESDGNLAIGLAQNVTIQGTLTVLGGTTLNNDLSLVGETKFTGQYIRLADSNTGAGLENYEGERAGILIDMGTQTNKYFVYDDSIGQFHWHDSGSQVKNVLLTTQNVQGTSGEIDVAMTNTGATFSLPATTTIDTLSTDNIQNTSGNITFTVAADGDINFKQDGVTNPALKIDTIGYGSDTNAPVMTTDGTNDFYVKSNALSIIDNDSATVSLSLQPHLNDNTARIWSGKELSIETTGSSHPVTLKGNTITLDASGDINLDAAGNDIFLKDAGTRFGRFAVSGSGVKMYGNNNNGYIFIEDSDIVLNGRVTFQGGVTEINATQLDIGDNIIVLNNDFTGSNPTQNAGIEVERGTKNNAKLQWNETGNYWEATNSDGSVGLGRIITDIDNATIPNSALQGGITINGTEVSLGGTITLNTDDISEDGSPTNLWFTTARARAAFTAGEGIDITNGEIKGEDATVTNKGIASFATADFSVSSGAVSIKTGGVSNSQLAGSIANSKLSNSSIGIGNETVSLGGSITAGTILGDGSLNNLPEVIIDGPALTEESLTIGTSDTSFKIQGAKHGIFIGDQTGYWYTGSTNAGSNRAYDETVVIGYQGYGGVPNAPSDAAESTDVKNGVAIGYRVLGYLDSGSGNVAIGHDAGYELEKGIDNVIVGRRALYSGVGNQTGLNNSVVIGASAANSYFQSTGGYRTNNIIIGHNAEPSTTSKDNEITLGDANISQFRIPGLLTTVNGNQNSPGGFAVFKSGVTGTNELEFSNHFKVDVDGDVRFEVGSTDDFVVTTTGAGSLVKFDHTSTGNNLQFNMGTAGQITQQVDDQFTLDVTSGDMYVNVQGGEIWFRDGSTPTAGIEFSLANANAPAITTELDGSTLRVGAHEELQFSSGINTIEFMNWSSSQYRPTTKFDTSTLDQLKVHTYNNTSSTYTINSIFYDDNLFVYGDVISASDARLKENVETVENGLDLVSKLRGVWYNKIDDENKTRKVGVIAQETEEVLPEVVQTLEDGTKSVDYGKMVGVLIEAIKELNQEVKELKAKIGE